MKNMGIGVFDSGVGGLTVVKEIKKSMPNENIVYFGDTKRVPYGNKPSEVIIEYCREIVDFLIAKQVKVIVIACNTATAHALETLESEYDIPIFGVISAGAISAVATTKNNKIGVIATNGTVKSKAYDKEILKIRDDITVISNGCSAFVMLAEEGLANHKGTELIGADYLQDILKQKVDTLILGCTHFPLLTNCIKNIVGNDVTLIDPAVNTTKNVLDYLKANNILSDKLADSDKYFVSGDIEGFKRVCNAIGFNIDNHIYSSD